MNIIVFVYLVVFSPVAVATTDDYGLVSLFCAFLDQFVTVTRFLFGLASLPCEVQIVTSVLALTFVGIAGTLTGSMIHTSYVAKGQPVWPRYLLILISICGWFVATLLTIILLGKHSAFDLIIPLSIVAGIMTKRMIHNKHSSLLVSSLLVLIYTVGWLVVIFMIAYWWIFSVAFKFCHGGLWGCGGYWPL